MKSVSLFSGIGGFDLAFQLAGIETDSVCEIDKAAQSILRRHFPAAKLYDDVRKVGKKTHERNSIDIVCGGFPCQDLSVAGKRAGLAGERSGLWFEFARVIDELEPRWVVIENVPGLLSSDKGRDFAVIIRWLAERGYGVAWRVLDAQHFGVPQRRRRVFIVGSLGSGRAAEVLFERESMSGDTPKGREAGKEVAYSLRANPSHSGDKGDGGINQTLLASGGDVAPTLMANYGTKWGLGDQEAFSGDYHVTSFTPRRTNMDALEDCSPTLNTGGGGMGGPAIVWDAQQETSKAHKTKPQGELSYTLNQAGQMMVGVRRLTPTECERLQGFPDGWTDGQADTVRYRQLGNAVAVPVVEWIARRIVAIS